MPFSNFALQGWLHCRYKISQNQTEISSHSLNLSPQFIPCTNGRKAGGKGRRWGGLGFVSKALLQNTWNLVSVQVSVQLAHLPTPPMLLSLNTGHQSSRSSLAGKGQGTCFRKMSPVMDRKGLKWRDLSCKMEDKNFQHCQRPPNPSSNTVLADAEENFCINLGTNINTSYFS